jgi:LuxR family transcriptional regulator of csgAB operon
VLNKIKLLIACRGVPSCLAIKELLKEKDFAVVDVVKEASCLDDTIRWARKSNPDILFLCSNFLIENWKDIITKITEKIKKTKVVVFNCHFSEEEELLLAKEGIVGILDCNVPPPILSKALKRVHDGEVWLKRTVLASLIDNGRLDFLDSLDSDDMEISGNGNQKLTKRELEIFSLIGNGHKNREISSKLCISELTVKTHIHNIFSKLEIENRLQAVLYAKKHVLNNNNH